MKPASQTSLLCLLRTWFQIKYLSEVGEVTVKSTDSNLKRTKALIPAPTQWLRAICYSSSRGSDILVWPLQTWGTHTVHRYVCRENTHIYKITLKGVHELINIYSLRKLYRYTVLQWWVGTLSPAHQPGIMPPPGPLLLSSRALPLDLCFPCSLAPHPVRGNR